MCPLGSSVAIIFNIVLSIATFIAGFSNSGYICGVLKTKSSIYVKENFTVDSFPLIDTTGYTCKGGALGYSISDHTAEHLISGSWRPSRVKKTLPLTVMPHPTVD